MLLLIMYMESAILASYPGTEQDSVSQYIDAREEQTYLFTSHSLMAQKRRDDRIRESEVVGSIHRWDLVNTNLTADQHALEAKVSAVDRLQYHRDEA